MPDSSYRLKRLLGDVISVVIRMESATKIRKPRYFHSAAFGILVKARREAQIIHGLPRDQLPHCQPILRSLLEGSVTLRWMLLKDKARRATRFFKFGHVEAVRIHEELPADKRTDEQNAFLERHQIERQQVRGMFYKKRRNGKWRWASTWSGLDLSSQIREIDASPTGSGAGRHQYMSYRLFSSHVHTTGSALLNHIDQDRYRGLRTKLPAHGLTIPILGLASLHLLDVADDANRELNLPYLDKLQALRDRAERLSRE